MKIRPSKKVFWIIILLSAGIIVINGSITDVYLGDESHHYRFAENIYREGRRVSHDPLYESGNPPGFFYNDPPFWHFGLALIWKILGNTSQTVAQIYHILFFILLLWITSDLCKSRIGEKEEWFTVLIIATVPMVVSFSILFYMDIPMTALATLSFYMIMKERYIEAGIASGLAYLTKLNFLFFYPGFLLIILFKQIKRLWILIKNLSLFILPFFIIYILDLNWRKSNIYIEAMNIISFENITNRITGLISKARYKEYLNAYLSNPLDIIKYFGLAFLLIFFYYIFQFRRWERRDITLWIPVVSYFSIFLIIFGINTDIRYLMPILPFLIVIFIPSIISLGEKWKMLLIIICILQFISTNYYVHQKRKIPYDIKEGFEFIKRNVPPKAFILYPEENLLIYGKRKIVWSAIKGNNSALGGQYLLFWGMDNKEINDLLKENNVNYILIKKSRIYNDNTERHTGGYPKSFVEKLSSLEGWAKIFENSELALWKKVDE